MSRPRPVVVVAAAPDAVLSRDRVLRVWRNRQSCRVTRAVFELAGMCRVVARVLLPRPVGGPEVVYVLGERLHESPPPDAAVMAPAAVGDGRAW